jgi:hypothetical protein
VTAVRAFRCAAPAGGRNFAARKLPEICAGSIPAGGVAEKVVTVRRALILAVLLMVTCVARAEIHKCTDKAGHKYYQDRPCDDGHQSAAFDPSAGNVTTIDSETSNRETQGALITREQTRERQVKATAPASAETHITISEPDAYPESGYGGYPVYIENDRRRRGDGRRGDRGERHGGEQTPTQEPPRRAGGNYVPAPPTIQQVAPRAQPASPSAASRERNSAPVRGRDDGRDDRSAR